MRQKNPRANQSRRNRQRGQVLVESALILIAFLMTLLATMDFSQVIFTHQMLVERVRLGLRYGMIHKWDGSGNDVANIIMYNTTDPKPGGPRTYPTLKRENILVTQVPGTVDDPNDLRLQVRIVGFKFAFFTPFLARTISTNYSVVESAPILFRE